MKKAVALLALIALLALAGFTSKGSASTGIYADPVEAIASPVHVEYGTGSQALAITMSMKAGGQTMDMAFDVDVDTRKEGDVLAWDMAIRDMKIKAGGKKNTLDGPFLNVALKTDAAGNPLGEEYSSPMLNKEQIAELKKSVEKSAQRPRLENQEVTTGSVLFSSQDSLAKELRQQGFALDDFKLEYVVAGYATHNGEKALLAKCIHPNGKLKEIRSGKTTQFGISGFILLRPENLQYILSETVMNVTIPGSSDKIVVDTVMKEK